MSRARISIATILCSSRSVSQGYVSSRRRSNRFRFFSCNGALLSRVLVCYYSEAAEESVYDSACLKQVPNRTEKVVGVRLRWRIRRESLEVGPLLGYECTTSLGQSQNQM